MRKYKVVRRCLVIYQCTDGNINIDLKIGQIWEAFGGTMGPVVSLSRDNVRIELSKDLFNQHFREVVKK